MHNTLIVIKRLSAKIIQDELRAVYYFFIYKIDFTKFVFCFARKKKLLKVTIPFVLNYKF